MPPYFCRSGALVPVVEGSFTNAVFTDDLGDGCTGLLLLDDRYDLCFTKSTVRCCGSLSLFFPRGGRLCEKLNRILYFSLAYFYGKLTLTRE